MRQYLALGIIATAFWTVAPAQQSPALPDAVTNNAVASGQVGRNWWIFSALGVDRTKRWSGITTRAAGWNSVTRRWERLPDVPGDRGRLAATAQVVRSRFYLVGGYTVDSAGNERSVPAVNIYDPQRGTWSRGTDIPVPVDDAVSGVYRDSLIYLVSGWHDTGNVQDVQVYDVAKDRWFVATPIPGPGVFGHSGALAGNTILFIDGAVKQDGNVKYRLESQSWTGTIDPRDPLSITWRRTEAHPGPALYRAAAAACGSTILIAGGTDNPYNYSGVGYDGLPSVPRRDVLEFDARRGTWRVVSPLARASMDHRALAVLPTRAYVVGGMQGEQSVSDRVTAWPHTGCRR
jgi:N-acetylneuraminic acid mutarotase